MRTAQEILRVEPPGGGGKPQEIDGEDGGNPSLCRNRVVPQDAAGAQSECQPWGFANDTGRRCTARSTATNRMKQIRTAPGGSSIRVVPALLLAGLSTAAHAAELPVTELAPITVSAHGGTAVPYDSTGVSVTVLDTRQLREEGVLNLGEALTRVPGVYVESGGGSNQRGNVNNIVIRGMSSGQYTLPMLDGMRLYDNTQGCNLTPNVLARTNVFDLGTLEVLKGSQGAIYGSGAVGGVIYMETPEGQGEPRCTLFNEIGSFSSYTGNLTAQGQQDKLSYFLSATYETTDNDLKKVNGTKPDDPKAGKYENRQEALRLDYRPDGDTHARITYRRSDARYQSPGTWSDPHFSYRTNLVSAALEKRLSHAFNSELSGGYYGADYAFGKGSNHDLRNVQLNWRNEYRWCRHQATTAGMGYMYSQHDYENAGQKDKGADHEENMLSLFAEHHITPTAGWDNSLALRWDESDVFGSLYTARVAGSFSFNDDRTRLSASIARGYKAPTSFQRSSGSYSDAYYTYRGNSALDCQTSWSADIGLEHEWKPGHIAGITLFWIRTEDAIKSNYLSNPVTFYNSGGHDTSQGIELSLSGTWEGHWETGYTLSLTLCDPQSSNGKQLAYTARQTWSADIHTSPLEGFTTGIGLSAASGRSNYQGGTPAMLDAYYTLRWYARYVVNEHLALHLRVENLTNQKYVSETDYMNYSQSYINAGTAVYGGCTITF